MGRKNTKGTARWHGSGMAALGVLPSLPKPAEVVGETFSVPGAFFNFTGHGAAANTKRMHEGTIVSFTSMHRFTAMVAGAAMELSFEGDSNNTWMAYPMPFLKHWYESHPQKKVGTDVDLTLSDSSGEDDWELEDDDGSASGREAQEQEQRQGPHR